MRFWLVAFVLVFTAVELFDWFAHLGSWHPTGLWLLLGGIGLAALSNLPGTAGDEITTEDRAAETVSQDKVPHSSEPVAKVSTGQAQTQAQAIETLTDDKNSVSFKVRPLKR